MPRKTVTLLTEEQTRAVVKRATIVSLVVSLVISVGISLLFWCFG